MSQIFFDSHGQAWETCRAADDGAEAFGPCGIARKIPFHWNQFLRTDIVRGDDGWDYVSEAVLPLLVVT